MLNFKVTKSLISLTTGIGLGLFLVLSQQVSSFFDEPPAIAGLVAFVLGVVWFLIERKEIGFGAIASILTIVLMPIATFPLYIIYLLSPLRDLSYFLQAPFEGLALLFVASGFFAVGLICVLVARKPKKLGFYFLISSLLFLIGVPLVNGYEVLATRHGSTWVATPYEGYTIPLILVSIAFFLLGCVSIFYIRFFRMKKSLVNTTAIEKERTEGDFTYEKRVELIGARNPFVSSWDAGFICLFIGSLSLIGAAVMYAPSAPWYISWSVPSTPSRELTGALVILCVASFTLGFNCILYKKSKRLGFSLGVLGSSLLFAAGFAHGYRTIITELVFGDVGVSHFINPLREYTLLLFLASAPFLVAGYTLMLKKQSLNHRI